MSSECHKPIIIYGYIYVSDEISQIYVSNILGVYRKKSILHLFCIILIKSQNNNLNILHTQHVIDTVQYANYCACSYDHRKSHMCV